MTDGRVSSRSTIDAKFPILTASKKTLEQVKNLLKQALSPVNAKLDGLPTKLNDIDKYYVVECE